MRPSRTAKKLTFMVLCGGLLLSAGVFGAQEIFDAIKAGDLTKVKSAIGKDPRTLDSLNPFDQTPLIVSLQERKGEIAAYLIACGAEVNARDRSHASSLSYAITGGLTDIAKRLIDWDADIDTPAMWGLRPLAFALEFGRLDIANMLIDKGAAIPVAPGEESYRLFFFACSNGFARLAPFCRVEYQDDCPFVTPDGKCLFFISWLSSDWASYWVKSDFIERLRPK